MSLRDKTQGGSSQIGWWEPETDAKHLAFISQSQSNGAPLILETGGPWGEDKVRVDSGGSAPPPQQRL